MDFSKLISIYLHSFLNKKPNHCDAATGIKSISDDSEYNNTFQ